MHKDLEYIEELVFKFQQGTIKPEELQELIAWYNSYSDEQMTIVTTEPLANEQVKQRMLNGLMSRIKSEEISPRAKTHRMRPWFWAASIAVVLLVFIAVWTGTQIGDIPRNVAREVQRDTILPGGNKATLLLGDGSQIMLDSAQHGIVMDDAIHYASGAQLDRKIDLSDIKDLQLYVPRGGIYQITLADGTQVWLNSGSRLKYPSQFSDTARTVELDGEAFFAVKPVWDAKKRRIPFVVKSRDQSIEVVGTQFNVHGYSTQSFTKTTLVEGLVNIHAQDRKIALSPGQQASTEGSYTQIKDVQPQHYTAWKEGKFSFDGKSFEESMNEVGRWYNLSIVYKSTIPNVELVGDAYRNERINLVLRLLDVADIRYKLDIGNRILIIY